MFISNSTNHAPKKGLEAKLYKIPDSDLIDQNV